MGIPCLPIGCLTLERQVILLNSIHQYVCNVYMYFLIINKLLKLLKSCRKTQLVKYTVIYEVQIYQQRFLWIKTMLTIKWPWSWSVTSDQGHGTPWGHGQPFLSANICWLFLQKWWIGHEERHTDGYGYNNTMMHLY